MHCRRNSTKTSATKRRLEARYGSSTSNEQRLLLPMIAIRTVCTHTKPTDKLWLGRSATSVATPERRRWYQNCAKFGCARIPRMDIKCIDAFNAIMSAHERVERRVDGCVLSRSGRCDGHARRSDSSLSIFFFIKRNY